MFQLRLVTSYIELVFRLANTSSYKIVYKDARQFTINLGNSFKVYGTRQKMIVHDKKRDLNYTIPEVVSMAFYDEIKKHF